MIELNYFDCRGRVQPIRNYLNERDIPFIDNRVSIADSQDWAGKAQDASFCGNLGLLPALHKDGEVINETLVIAFEIEPSMSLQERMLISSTYDDVIVNVGLLIWADMAFPGLDLKATTKIMFTRMMHRFARYEQSEILDANGRFFTLAQHFLGESIDAARYAFGTNFEAVLQKCSRLHAFDLRYQELASRFARPIQFTGRPNEIEAVKAIRRATPNAS
jgi:hypothetical protein